MSYSSDMRIRTGQKTVAAAGTRDILATGHLENVRVKSITIRALTANTNLVYIGDQTVSSAVGFPLSAGGTVTIEVTDYEWDHGDAVDITKIWLDVAVNGEGVAYILLS